MTRAGLILALAAVTMLGWPAASAPARVLHIPLCHGGVLDVPVGPEAPQHDKSCPSGCHAPLCQSRKRPGSPSV
jgi:hypothetical protein